MTKLDRKAFEQVLLTTWARASCNGESILPPVITRFIDGSYKCYLREDEASGSNS